jgi:nitrogen-specific signal transduction histidine kinase/CheY-like chemotaxis protein
MKSDVVFALENAGWPALLIDSESTICRANQTAIKIFGAALEGSSPLLSAIWSQENSGKADQFLSQWERSPAPAVPIKLRAKGGNSVSYLVSICSFTKEAQKYFVMQLFPEGLPSEQPAKSPVADGSLAQKQKLDCALQLARTVSLDFNNALTSILGHTSLVLSRMEAKDPWRNSLVEVEKAAGKAAEIANDLGSFSHQEKDQRGQASGNLNLLLQRCVEFFQKDSGAEPIAWSFQLERQLFSAKFDELKMQQTFLRIIENSVQAINSHGRINVQTRNIELSEPTQDRNARLAAGAYVCVEIGDNGCGIEAEVLSRIFEPFFTTKRNHRGLGLAWVYGIVTNHGGSVAVSSKLGAGATVRVYLPAEKTFASNEDLLTKDLNGNQTVLIVDDEDLVLKMGETILSAYGYRVLTAAGGQKALDILNNDNGPIDLVISDLVMPGMSGRQLVEQIQKLWPEKRILCTSGYVWPSGQEHERAYLQKPFTSQELLMKVKQALAEEARSE